MGVVLCQYSNNRVCLNSVGNYPGRRGRGQSGDERESGLQREARDSIRNPSGGLALCQLRAMLSLVTKGNRQRKQAEVGRSVDLAGEIKHFHLGVPDFFMGYEVVCPPRGRRKRMEVVTCAGDLTGEESKIIMD